jgi:hypothetical protein
MSELESIKEQVARKLEPGAMNSFHESFGEDYLASIAISLKRIADIECSQVHLNSPKGPIVPETASKGEQLDARSTEKP